MFQQLTIVGYLGNDGTRGANYEVTAINVRFLPGGGSEQPNGADESATDDGLPF